MLDEDDLLDEMTDEDIVVLETQEISKIPDPRRQPEEAREDKESTRSGAKKLRPRAREGVRKTT